MKAEISFDLVMDDDMGFVEGTYRLPGENWHVFIFSTFGEHLSPKINPNAKWESGVTGIHVDFPKSQRLNKAAVLKILSEVLDVTEWVEVMGPDSMNLR